MSSSETIYVIHYVHMTWIQKLPQVLPWQNGAPSHMAPGPSSEPIVIDPQDPLPPPPPPSTPAPGAAKPKPFLFPESGKGKGGPVPPKPMPPPGAPPVAPVAPVPKPKADNPLEQCHNRPHLPHATKGQLRLVLQVL